jgi:hypothetical protein
MHQPVEADALPVRLVSIGEVEHVNRLAPSQSLTFGQDGVTVVYGHNGSGKSGYARLIRQMVRARHRGAVLPDIFDAVAGPQQAELAYVVGDDARTAQFGGGSPSDLAQVTFYDERCGDSYVTAEAEVTYRPPALRLMDDLIAVCGRVRAELDRLIAKNTERAIPLPRLPEDTEPGQFVARLSATTTDREIETACTAPDDSEAIIANARDEEARLRATDPTKEKSRLTRLAGHMATLADHFDQLDAALGPAAEAAVREVADQAQQMRAAADLASSEAFGREPLIGAGSQTWRALWDAARAYSETTAYQTQPFPVTNEGARCVLCQQALDGEARQRLDRFQAYISDRTEHQAHEAERALREHTERLRAVQVRPADVHVALLAVEDNDPSLAPEISSLLDTYSRRLAALSEVDAAEIPAADATNVTTRLRDYARTLGERAVRMVASQPRCKRLGDEVAFGGHVRRRRRRFRRTRGRVRLVV